jgi:hypothetical protein
MPVPSNSPIPTIHEHSPHPPPEIIAANPRLVLGLFWGAETESEAREILEDEIAATLKWAADEVEAFDPETTTIPEIAQILVRPEADEDGDYDDLNSWEAL